MASTTNARAAKNQTLLFDADDTLWENNIYFERAIAAFISYLDHRVHTADEVRERLNHVERATIAQHGYGLQSFRKSLVQCFEQLSAATVTPDKHERIVSFVNSIAEQEIELLPGVADALGSLAERHRCILVTKGDKGEQQDKLERSGLAGRFVAVEILPEKNDDAYRTLIAEHKCVPHETWMIGNSPRSDVKPRARGRAERSLHPARLYLGARARNRSRATARAATAGAGLVHRAAGAFLTPRCGGPNLLYSTSD